MLGLDLGAWRPKKKIKRSVLQPTRTWYLLVGICPTQKPQPYDRRPVSVHIPNWYLKVVHT